MGITPITNLTPVEDIRPLQSVLEPAPLAKVENSARINDETYSPSQGDSAGSAEDDAPEAESSEELLAASAGEDQPEPTELSDKPAEGDTSNQINFFA
jgi:hypothetical protein